MYACPERRDFRRMYACPGRRDFRRMYACPGRRDFRRMYACPGRRDFLQRQVSPCEASMRRTTVCPWLCARMSVMVVIWGCFLSTGRIRGLSAHGRHGFVLQWCGAKSLLQRSNAACGYSRLPEHAMIYCHPESNSN